MKFNEFECVYFVGIGGIGMSALARYFNSLEIDVYGFDKVETVAAKDISQILVRSTILHGKLTELIHNAQDPKSDKGETISVLEKKEINEAITDLENKIMKIKMTIDTKF